MTSSRHRITIDLIGEEGKQLHDLLTYYRLLRRESWQQMMLESLELLARSENDAIANAIEAYRLNHTRGKAGRPRGTRQPSEMKRNHSRKMKEYWEKKRAELNNITV